MLSFAPSFPTGWHHASATLPYGKAHYQIKFEATADHDETVVILEDGVVLTSKFVTMIDDKRVHEIIVRFKGQPD
jgi:hypothetical protein